ncbi:MAG: cupin domain-containing protein [Proteobacteria bacterium]|nr:cupin domain-containing protein [Pseudomonadota bacterium]MBU1581603.1 cupin domain-containing protein [Pseudomonadota bacterium]
MKVANYKDVLPIVMDNEMVKNVAGRVMIGKQDGAENFCMRVFEMGEDGFTPKHAHDWEHEVFVHAGTGEVFIEDKWYPLSSGSAIFVPANIEHQFRNTSDKIFTFVCLIPSAAPEI